MGPKAKFKGVLVLDPKRFRKSNLRRDYQIPTIKITSNQLTSHLHQNLTHAWRFRIKPCVARTKTFTSLRNPKPHQMFAQYIGNTSHSKKGASDEHPA